MWPFVVVYNTLSSSKWASWLQRVGNSHILPTTNVFTAYMLGPIPCKFDDLNVGRNQIHCAINMPVKTASSTSFVYLFINESISKNVLTQYRRVTDRQTDRNATVNTACSTAERCNNGPQKWISRTTTMFILITHWIKRMCEENEDKGSRLMNP